MNEFRKYDSVERMGKEDTEGILNGTVYLQTKMDGSNISIYWDNGIVITSRNRILYKDGVVFDNFSGLVDKVLHTSEINTMVGANPYYIFYAEYTRKHTIKYPLEITNQIYFYDIFSRFTGKYLPSPNSELQFKMYHVNYIPILATLQNPTLEEVKKYMLENPFDGQPQNEGIVIKNPTFVNKFGRQCYGKLVNEQFKEQNKEIFGKRSKCCKWHIESELESGETPGDLDVLIHICTKCGKECEVEIYEPPKKINIEEKIALEYITKNRVEKIINKIIDSYSICAVGCSICSYYKGICTKNLSNNKISEKDTPQILSRVYNDVIKEEAWEILKEYKNPIIDFKKLQKHCYNLTKKYFFEYLENRNV